MARIAIKLAGTPYGFDTEDLELADLFMIKNASGLTINGLMRGLEDGDPDALQTMIWFVRRKAGETGLVRETVNFKISEFEAVINNDPPDEGSTAASTGPPSETSTSDSSDTSSTTPPATSTV